MHHRVWDGFFDALVQPDCVSTSAVPAKAAAAAPAALSEPLLAVDREGSKPKKKAWNVLRIDPNKALGSVMRSAWSAFGAVPILCCYVATMPVSSWRPAGLANEAPRTERDTLYFAIAASALGTARVCYALYQTYLVARSDKSKKEKRQDDVEQGSGKGIAAAGAAADRDSWASLLFEGIQAYQVAVHLISSSMLFLLFCQDNPRFQVDRKRINGTSFSSYEGYAEYAYVLALIAACRLSASSFSADQNAAGYRAARRAGGANATDKIVEGVPVTETTQRDRTPLGTMVLPAAAAATETTPRDRTLVGIMVLPAAGTETTPRDRTPLGAMVFPAAAAATAATKPAGQHHCKTFLPYVDAVLSIVSPAVFIAMCCTLPTGEYWRDTFVLSSSMMQRFMHWQMFLMLCFTYLFHHNFFIVSRVVDGAIRTLVLTLGFTAFHMSLGSMKTPSFDTIGNSARAQLVDYYAIRAWAVHGVDVWSAIGRALLQVWASLQTCRWFVAACHITLGRLKLMRLDLQKRHAADVEDIYFALAVSCILGAAYASHPLIPSATSPSPSAFYPISDMEAGKHQAFSLQFVLGTVLWILGGTAVLHWGVSVVKGWFRDARKRHSVD